MPFRLTDQQKRSLAAMDSPSERLRYLQGRVGLDEPEALRCLAAWIESQGASTRSEAPDVAPTSERIVEYDDADVPFCDN